MNRRINQSTRRFYLIILVSIFFTPHLVKDFHFLFVHHEHKIISVAGKREFSKIQKSCPICSFEFYKILDDLCQVKISEPKFFPGYCVSFYKNIFLDFFIYSFPFRGPPSFIL